MSPVAYDLLSDRETSPFEGLAPDDSREVTFHVGARCDRALLNSGLCGEIDWLWAVRIPNGRVTLVEGPAGAGKSLVALDLAARLSDDRAWPDGAPQARRGSKALILCRQDDPGDVVGARLKAMGANSQRCVQFHEFETIDNDERLNIRPLALPLDLPALAHLLRRDPSIRLLVIDSLSDFCAGKGELAEVLHQLNRLACEHRVAIIATLRADVRFDRLAQVATKSPFDTGAARCRWCCVRDPEDRRRLMFLPTQMNYAELPTGLAFRPGQNRLDWLEGSIDPYDPIRKLSECGQWLSELLADKAEHSKTVIGLGKEFGFSEGQVRRAFTEIGAQREREGFQTGSSVVWMTKDEFAMRHAGFRKRDDEECGVRNSECGRGDGVQFRGCRPAAEFAPITDADFAGDAPEAAASGGNETPREIRPARPVAAPAAEADRPNGDGQVGKAAFPGRILGVEELPWADSPSSRLNPLSVLLDRPNNPNQLLRSMKSMQSRESRK